MKRTSILSVFLLWIGISVLAQDSYIENPKMISENKLEPHGMFHSFSSVEKAIENDRKNATSQDYSWGKDYLQGKSFVPLIENPDKKGKKG